MATPLHQSGADDPTVPTTTIPSAATTPSTTTPVTTIPSPTDDRRAGERRPFTAVVRGVSKKVSPTQLGVELGVDVCTSVNSDGTVVVLADVDQKILEAAITSHVARDPRGDALALLQARARTDPTIAALLQVLGF